MRSKYIRIKPNEGTNSNKHNAINNNAVEDIADLYKSYISLRNDTEAVGLYLTESTNSILSFLTSLDTKIEDLQTNLAGVAPYSTMISLYDDSLVVYPTSLDASEQCYIDTGYGESILPISNINIEYHYINPETLERGLIQNIENKITSAITNNQTETRVDEIYENNVINAIDVSSNKAHIIKAITNNADISSITAIYTLETESGLDINCIKIHPIPDMKAEITSVVTDTINGAIENVTDTNGTSVMFPAAVEDKPYFKRKKSFRFPAKKIANLTVNITNDEYDVIDNLGSKQFILGARVISMESVTYLNSGYLGFKLPIPAGKSKVHKVIPSYEGTPDNIELTVYDIEDEFNEIGDQYLLTGTADVIDDIVDTVITNLSAEYIYVLIKMTKQINESTPILKGLVVSWS